VKICRSQHFSKMDRIISDHFEWKFQTEGGIATIHCWCQKSRVIALSCGINTRSALFSFVTKHACVLSQSTRVMDRRTDGQNYDSQDCASIDACAVRTVFTCCAIASTVLTAKSMGNGKLWPPTKFKLLNRLQKNCRS